MWESVVGAIDPVLPTFERDPWSPDLLENNETMCIFCIGFSSGRPLPSLVEREGEL